MMNKCRENDELRAPENRIILTGNPFDGRTITAKALRIIRAAAIN